MALERCHCVHVQPSTLLCLQLRVHPGRHWGLGISYAVGHLRNYPEFDGAARMFRDDIIVRTKRAAGVIDGNQFQQTKTNPTTSKKT